MTDVILTMKDLMQHSSIHRQFTDSVDCFGPILFDWRKNFWPGTISFFWIVLHGDRNRYQIEQFIVYLTISNNISRKCKQQFSTRWEDHVITSDVKSPLMTKFHYDVITTPLIIRYEALSMTSLQYSHDVTWYKYRHDFIKKSSSLWRHLDPSNSNQSSENVIHDVDNWPKTSSRRYITLYTSWMTSLQRRRTRYFSMTS